MRIFTNIILTKLYTPLQEKVPIICNPSTAESTDFSTTQKHSLPIPTPHKHTRVLSSMVRLKERKPKNTRAASVPRKGSRMDVENRRLGREGKMALT